MSTADPAPFEEMQFCFPWRAYQAAVLDDLDTHLEDRKLHVVAAPGAGKTVLGLEVIRRIGKPTLILAPSLAIRNQWVSRLAELFLATKTCPDWVSVDLKAPALITVTTYQALHMHHDIEPLRKAGVAVIALDEAHHLRNSWWEALDLVVKGLDAKTVSLTATPPYDVASQEWRRYHELCGPIDAEISIPELVKSEDLAPHQDLVHYSQLERPDDYQALDHVNDDLFRGLVKDEQLVARILEHPWIADTRIHTPYLLADPDLFSAMLIYLADAGAVVPKYALRVLGVGQSKVPKISDAALQCLCQGLLPDLPDHLVAHLTKCNALYRGRVSVPVVDIKQRERLLRNAPEKFGSIRDVAAAERLHLGDTLRMAILCEHVGANAIKLAAAHPDTYRPEKLRNSSGDDKQLARLDAGSTFERLRLEPGHPADLAVLTGSLLIVPAGSLVGAGIKARQLPHDPRYEQLSLAGPASDKRVELVSKLVSEGAVRMLIGTRALLGQGWDLPAINTLILATNVASFVSSNQIRGRAIRRHAGNPEKVANIWHIATTAPNERGPEVEALERRFDTFMHLDLDRGEIRSGLRAPSDIVASNKAALKQAAARDQIAGEWQTALTAGGPNPHVRHGLETKRTPRGLVKTDAMAQIIPRMAVSGGGLGFWATALGDPVSGALFLGGAAVIMVPGFRRLKRVIDHGTLAGSLKQTGFAVLHGMIAAEQIKTARGELDVTTGRSGDGFTYCSLNGATLPEESRFLEAMSDLFSPIDNPRYIILRQSYLGKALQTAPYPVPKELSGRKEHAQGFLDGWRRYVGPAKLVYTRSVAGRLALLQARTVALAETREIRRTSVWE